MVKATPRPSLCPMLWSQTLKYRSLECCFNTQFLRSFWFIFGSAQFPHCRSLSGLQQDAKMLGMGCTPPPVGGCLPAAGLEHHGCLYAAFTLSTSEERRNCSWCRRGGSSGLCWKTNVVWVDGVGGSLRIPPQDSFIYVCHHPAFLWVTLTLTSPSQRAAHTHLCMS